ncbi:CopG family transcriptional regulator [Candidatus Parcubacteria bacterium]|nr:MAG: CopG family transcriptional regulator [Candidatus Parcubacteria bacterium]
MNVNSEPKQKKVFAFWLSVEAKRELEKMAETMDVSISHIIRQAVKEFLEKNKNL